jgi:hypothetical protein
LLKCALTNEPREKPGPKTQHNGDKMEAPLKGASKLAQAKPGRAMEEGRRRGRRRRRRSDRTTT